jgi:hypothetical protein
MAQLFRRDVPSLKKSVAAGTITIEQGLELLQLVPTRLSLFRQQLAQAKPLLAQPSPQLARRDSLGSIHLTSKPLTWNARIREMDSYSCRCCRLINTNSFTNIAIVADW